MITPRGADRKRPPGLCPFCALGNVQNQPLLDHQTGSFPMLNEMSKKALGSLQPSGRTAPSNRLTSIETTSAISAGGRSLRVEGDETRRSIDRLDHDCAHRRPELGPGFEDLYGMPKPFQRLAIGLFQREPDGVEDRF